MHSTLTTRTNAILVVAWGAIAVDAVVMTNPRPIVPLVMGCACGVGVGVLQAKAITRAAGRLRQVETAMEVRRTLVSSESGKWAIRGQWICAGALLLLAMLQGSAVGGFVAGYTAFMCIRELTSLGAVIRLNVDA